MTVEQLSKTQKLGTEKLLEHLVGAGITGKTARSSLSKEEKNILNQYLRSKRSRNRKVLSSKAILTQQPSKTTKIAGIATVQIKRKKVVPTTTTKIINEKDKAVLKAHQDSIKNSQLEAKKQKDQDAKRRDLVRQQAQKAQATKKVTQGSEEKTSTPKKVQPPSEKKTKRTVAKPNLVPSKNNHQPKKTPETQSVEQYQINSLPSSHGRKLKKKEKTRLSQKLREEQSGQHQFVKPVEKVVYEVKVPEVISVATLAEQMKVKAAEVLKQMMVMGVMATINDNIDHDTAMLVVEEMGHIAITQEEMSVEDIALSELEDIADQDKLARVPIVAVMGHVDHGKTSLLDYIRQANVAKAEVGGITQHIGAYQVGTKNGKITFLDTPGHSAFTQMRSRGANATDIVILVVAADDGVMPETIDSIKHAKAAGTTIIVAINKMDKEGVNSEKVRQTLSTHGVIDESWGGDALMVEVSAHSGKGIDELLEAIILQAEVLELSAVKKARAKGVVLEAKVEKGRGKIATLLVQEGTLKKGDIIVAGQEYGKVKQLLDETNKTIKEAVPSTPVEMLGLSGIPEAGDSFVVLSSERKAKEVADYRCHKNKELRLQKQQVMKMEDFMVQMQTTGQQKINVLLKADVQGSVQAITYALETLNNDKLDINIVSTGVGAINETDMALASTSNAVVLGFGVRADAVARKTAEQEKIDVRYYSVIYNLIDDVKAMMSGLLVPELSEEIIGLAEVKEVFRSKTLGDIAGCIVTEGKVRHNNPIRVLRDNVVVYEGELESLRRFKDEVNEVVSGTECGIGIKNYNNVQAGDQIEVFERVENIAKS